MKKIFFYRYIYNRKSYCSCSWQYSLWLLLYMQSIHINVSEPGSQSVGLAWMCFVGICRHCRGFPVHWLWNQFYPNWICQSQSKVEGNTIQHCQFYKPGLLEGKVLLKVKSVIPVPPVAPNGIIKIMKFKLIFNLTSQTISPAPNSCHWLSKCCSFTMLKQTQWLQCWKSFFRKKSDR